MESAGRTRPEFGAAATPSKSNGDRYLVRAWSFPNSLASTCTAPAGLTDTLDFRDETLGAPTEADA